MILGLFKETEQCLCSVNRQIKLEISASAWLISAPNRNLICKAFKTAPTWQEAAHLAAAGAQPRVCGLCCVMGAKGRRSPGARQRCAMCQLCAGAGGRDTLPLRLLRQCASWEWLSLQHVNAAVNAGPESLPEQMACDGAEGPQWDGHIWKGESGLVNWWRKVAWCQLLGAVGNQTNFTE